MTGLQAQIPPPSCHAPFRQYKEWTPLHGVSLRLDQPLAGLIPKVLLHRCPSMPCRQGRQQVGGVVAGLVSQSHHWEPCLVIADGQTVQAPLPP